MDYLFTSERLGFRTWQDGDNASFVAMNKDPEVMEYFPNPLTDDQTLGLISRIRRMFDEYDYGLYAVDVLDSEEFIGFVGFLHPKFDLEFTPCKEIGWRLKRSAWYKGYATEGAQSCLKHGFENLGFEEVQSWTAKVNDKSERVMQKIGMSKAGEFDHPLLEQDSDLTRHVRYKISKEDFVK